MFDKLKEVLKKMLGRDLTPEEVKELEAVDKKEDKIELVKTASVKSDQGGESDKTLDLVARLAERVETLAVAINKQSEFTKAISDDFSAKAEKEKSAKIDEKIAAAKTKGLIPNDNEKAEAEWRKMLASEFAATSAIIESAAQAGGKKDEKPGAAAAQDKTDVKQVTNLETLRASAADAFDSAVK